MSLLTPVQIAGSGRRVHSQAFECDFCRECSKSHKKDGYKTAQALQDHIAKQLQIPLTASQQDERYCFVCGGNVEFGLYIEEHVPQSQIDMHNAIVDAWNELMEHRITREEYGRREREARDKAGYELKPGWGAWTKKEKA